MNPPRAAARVLEQETQTAYYSDSPDEGSDQELRAMQNIRNRARRRQDGVCFSYNVSNWRAASEI